MRNYHYYMYYKCQQCARRK